MTMKVNDTAVTECNEKIKTKERDIKSRDDKRHIVSRLSHEKGKSSIKSGGRWCRPRR